MPGKGLTAPVPDRAFRRIADIDIEDDIEVPGYKLVVLDVDGTVKNRLLRAAPPDTIDWIKRCRERGVFVCFVSNDRRERHISFSDELELPIIAAAHKPSPASVSAILSEYGVSPRQAVIIGNNPFTDVLCGHRAGISAYLVRPIETTKNRLRKRTKSKWRVGRRSR